MPYTAAQLTTYYTNVNGIPPDAATQQFFAAYAQQNAAGTLSDAATLQTALASGQTRNGIDVSVETYSYFNGTTPSAAGIAYLDTNTAANPNNLNSTYFSQFNTENRYYNFAINLALAGPGAATFATNYGSLTLSQYISLAYEQIIGSVNVGATNAAAALAYLNSPAELQAFATLTTARTGLAVSGVAGSQFDLAQKAVVAGLLLEEGTKSDVGTYAKAMDQFVASVANGTAIYGTNLVTTYSTGGAGFNTGIGVGGTGVANTQVTLLPAGDVITTGSNTTYNAVVNGAVANASTLTGADNVAPTGTGNTLSVTYQSNAAGSTAATLPAAPQDPSNGAIVSGIQTLNLRSITGDAQTYAASTIAGLTNVNSNLSSDAVTFTNLSGTSSTVGLIGNGAAIDGNLTAIFGTTPTNTNTSTATTAPTINLTGGLVGTSASAGAPNIVIGGVPTTATINSTGAANVVGGIQVSSGAYTTATIVFAAGATVSTLNVSAATNLTLQGALTGLTGAATVNVSGGAASVNFGTTAFANGLTINASGMTAGGVTATIGNDTFTGGAGNDVVTLTAGTTLTNSVVGGGGVNTIALTTQADDSAANAAKVSGFTTLQVSNNTGGAQTYDASVFSGITLLNVATSANPVTVSNLVANPTVNVTGTQTLATTLLLANAGGASDVLNLNVTAGKSIGTSVATGLALGGTGTAGQVETLNLTGVAAAAFAGGAGIGTVFLQSSGGGAPFVDPNTVKITGAIALGLTTGVEAHGITIDGSTATGSLIINNSANTGIFAVNVNGSTANDTITTSAEATGNVTQTVFGGGGGDTIILGARNGVAGGTQVADQLIYKAATDSQLDFTGTTGASGTATANTGKMDVVTNFLTGTDKIDLTQIAAANGVLGGGFANYTATDTSTNFNSVLATANFFNDASATTRGIAEIQVGADTYVIVNTAGGTTYNASDLVIKLAGASTVVASDFLHS